MSQAPQSGSNRTGIGLKPERAADMRQAAKQAGASSTGRAAMAAMRKAANPPGARVGSVPDTGALGQAIAPEMAGLADKLGARLAFERSGVRLYEALLQKLDAWGTFDGGPEVGDLQDLRREELEHFEMLEQAILELGGDPAAMTPSADLESNTGKGVGDVIGDPRTTLLESLEAILVAELADNECWDTLAELAASSGQADLASRCRAALQTEEEHLIKVRTWVKAGHGLAPTRH